MANISNLRSFLQDIASAIRNKNGSTVNIRAENFDVEINNIQTGVMTEEEYNLALATATSILNSTEIVPTEDIVVTMTDASALVSSVTFGAPLGVTGAECVLESSNMVQVEAWFPDNTETTRTFLFSDNTYNMPSTELGTTNDGIIVYYEYLSDVDAYNYAWKITEEYAYSEVSLVMTCKSEQTLEDISSIINNLTVKLNSDY